MRPHDVQLIVVALNTQEAPHLIVCLFNFLLFHHSRALRIQNHLHRKNPMSRVELLAVCLDCPRILRLRGILLLLVQELLLPMLIIKSSILQLLLPLGLVQRVLIVYQLYVLEILGHECGRSLVSE